MSVDSLQVWCVAMVRQGGWGGGTMGSVLLDAGRVTTQTPGM